MIRSVELRNFKCFDRQTIDLRQLTLLSGLNGAGKSTVIQSLLLLRQSFLEGLLPEKGLSLNGELVRLGTAADVLFEGAEEETIGFCHSYSEDNESPVQRAEWQFRYDAEADVLKPASVGSHSEDDAVYRSGLFGEAFHYLQAERLGPRAVSEVSDYVVRRLKQLGSRGEYAVHYLAVYGDVAIPNLSLVHPEAASTGLRDQAEAWLGAVSPGTRLDFAQYRDVDVVRLHYSFVRGSHVTKPFRATNVGFGISYVLPVLVALLATPPGGLILIENPEAHLHPRGQALFGRLCARAAAAGVQVLVETHSDHVLNGVRLAVRGGLLSPDNTKVLFFDRSASNALSPTVLTPKLDRDGRLDPWPEGFFDEMDRALLEMMAPRK